MLGKRIPDIRSGALGAPPAAHAMIGSAISAIIRVNIQERFDI